MTPGVTGVGGGGVNTAGQLSRNNSYLVDGVSNDDTIVSSSRGGFSLEAVREYVVLANQFSAEYGVSSGAIVSVVTRSGTNKNEGRAFYFGRNDAFDAQDPFSKAQGSGKAPFNQDRGGGFWGGPILRDRLFYFSSYEGQPHRQDGCRQFNPGTGRPARMAEPDNAAPGIREIRQSGDQPAGDLRAVPNRPQSHRGERYRRPEHARPRRRQPHTRSGRGRERHLRDIESLR